MCETHAQGEPAWIRRIIMKIYGHQVEDTLGFYLTLGELGQAPLIGGIVRFVAGLYGRKVHGGRAATIDECMEVLEQARQIYAIDCSCRARSGNCAKPKRTCLTINTGAELVGEIKQGDRISAIEAERILRDSNAHGLISSITHCVSPHVYAICNCCTCCCVPYRLRFRYGIKSALDNGHMVARLDPDRCRQCNRCREACPGHAIDSTAGAVRPESCLGCGLCAGVCPHGAVEMLERGERPRQAVPGRLESLMLYAGVVCVVLPLAVIHKMVSKFK